MLSRKCYFAPIFFKGSHPASTLITCLTKFNLQTNLCPKLSLVCFVTYSPMKCQLTFTACFQNEEGKMSGIDADFMTVLAEKYGFVTTWVKTAHTNFKLSPNDYAVRCLFARQFRLLANFDNFHLAKMQMLAEALTKKNCRLEQK